MKKRIQLLGKLLQSWLSFYFSLDHDRKALRKLQFYQLYLKEYKSQKPQKLKRRPAALDIVIPAIERDIEVLRLCVESLRRFCLNPIDNIYVVSGDNKAIKDFSINNNCVFVPENNLGLPNKETINYVVNFEDRAGWLFQQFIKLSADRIAKNDFILIVDADTILIRPQYFVKKNKMILNCSDEYHKPYFFHFTKLLGRQAEMPMSFIAHHMIFNKNLLIKLKHVIEKRHGCNWVKAIMDYCDFTNISCFSEYETWGNFLYIYHRNYIKLAYSNNIPVFAELKEDLQELVEKYAAEYKSISYHWYDRANI